MPFLETPRFPEKIAMGARIRILDSVERIRLANGYEQTNRNWSQSLREYTISMPLHIISEMEALRAFYLSVGLASGFRLKDWTDYQCAQTDGFLGTSALGTGMPAYQLHKKYLSGALSQFRQIRKPASGTVVPVRNSVDAVAGVGAGQYALDTTTGIVTWVADSSANVTAFTAGTSTLITLQTALTGLVVGGKLYLSGLTGTVASTLNGLAHTITNIASSTYTLSTVTTGLAWSGGGQGYKYPQPADSLAWRGEFDTPCGFTSELAMATVAQNVHMSEQFTLAEIRV